MAEQLSGSSTNQQRSSIHDFDNMVTVLVGKEEKRFTLHQDAVCAKSKFFQAACSKEWLEGQERVVRLPETEDTTFHEYCTWVYSGKIADSTCTTSSTETQRMNEHDQLLYLYLLGDKLDDIQLRNQAIIKLFKSMQNGNLLLRKPASKLVWESTVRGSPLRKLIVDVMVTRIDRSSFAASVSQYSPEFLQEIAVAALQAAPLFSWEHMAQNLSLYEEREKS